MQLDLVKMDLTDGPYKYFAHYRDHFSKYSVLFPLCSKEAKEVSNELEKRVFAYFGVPSILQMDNGTEFRNEVNFIFVILYGREEEN